jgi:hypothetical protein
MAEHVALAEAAVAVLGEGRVVGHRIFEVDPAEPAVRQVQMHLLAQPALGADAEAMADDQHPDHQFRVDGGAAGVAVERREVLAQTTEVKNPVDAAKQVVARDVIVEVEGVEQLVLRAASLTHHRNAHPRLDCDQLRPLLPICQGSFSTE